jgi:hypothetical protein
MSSFLPVLTPTLERGRITAPPLLGPSRPRRLRASLDASVAEGAAAEVFGACAGGAVLTGWALYLGASAVTIGLLTALPVAAQVLQLPAAWLTQRLGAKPLAVASIGTSRLVWLPMLAVPFLGLSDVAALATFVMVVTVASILGVVGNNAWTAWMGDLVPGAIRGRFFSRRLIYINVAGTLATLAAGLALDALTPRGFKGETLGALAAIACVAGAISIWLLLVQQGPVHADATPPRWADLARSVRDPRTRPLLGYFLAWHAAVGISAGFFSYHMLANLEMGSSSSRRTRSWWPPCASPRRPRGAASWMASAPDRSWWCARSGSRWCRSSGCSSRPRDCGRSRSRRSWPASCGAATGSPPSTSRSAWRRGTGGRSISPRSPRPAASASPSPPASRRSWPGCSPRRCTSAARCG